VVLDVMSGVILREKKERRRDEREVWPWLQCTHVIVYISSQAVTGLSFSGRCAQAAVTGVTEGGVCGGYACLHVHCRVVVGKTNSRP
jgi:hypothetical protein